MTLSKTCIEMKKTRLYILRRRRRVERVATKL
jgi:hypothetical protein